MMLDYTKGENKMSFKRLIKENFELIGSEKQIAWAEKILKLKIKKLNEWFNIVKKSTKEKAKEELKEIKKDFEFLKKITRADFVIKYRDEDIRKMREDIENDPYKDSETLRIKY